MYSFSRIEGWYDGRPVAAGSTPSKLISARSISSTNTLITRTGLSSSMKSSRHSGNSVHCPRSTSSMKRLINPPKNHGRIITAAQRFHTARVTNVQFHRGRASNLFRSDPKSGHSVVHVRSAALCHNRKSGVAAAVARLEIADGPRAAWAKRRELCEDTTHAATRTRATHLEGTMFAGVRNVAWGAAMVMAGLLAVFVTNCIWMAYFRLYEAILSILSGPRPG